MTRTGAILTRTGAILLAVVATLSAAAAQERPPGRPSQDSGAAARPEKDEPAAQAPDPRAQAPAARNFGPPPPPAWWLLRETDQDFAACRLALSWLGTAYTQVPAITDPADRDCGIARPIRVDRILPDLALEGGAVMRCDTARALGFWARDFLRPAATALPGSPRVTGLRLGTAYDCRPRVGADEERPKLSEHALGDAIDISAVLFADAQPLAIQPRSDTGDLAEAFQRTLRASGCLFFATVLGPGTNDAHDDHLHLDSALRPNGWRLCQ